MTGNHRKKHEKGMRGQWTELEFWSDQNGNLWTDVNCCKCGETMFSRVVARGTRLPVRTILMTASLDSLKYQVTES